MSPTPQPTLPDAELEVLACLSRLSETTARVLREAMESYRPMAHGSMVTLLERLRAKGLVERRRGPVGKAFLYRPTRKAHSTFRNVIKTRLHRVFGGNRLALFSTLLDTAPPSEEELEQLQELLDELKRKRT